MERAATLIRRFGRFVHDSRKEYGFTQAQLAARAGMSKKHLGDIERGDVAPSLSALDCLARAFDMNLLELLNPIVTSSGRRRPTLDLRKWLRVQETLHMLSDHTDQVVSHAKAFGAESESVSSVHRRRPRASRKRPSRSPQQR